MPLPQRDGRPSLDLTPDATPVTAGWAEKFLDPANELNAAVPMRKGPPAPNGYTREPYSVVPTDTQGVKTPDRAR